MHVLPTIVVVILRVFIFKRFTVKTDEWRHNFTGVAHCIVLCVLNSYILLFLEENAWGLLKERELYKNLNA